MVSDVDGLKGKRLDEFVHLPVHHRSLVHDEKPYAPEKGLRSRNMDNLRSSSYLIILKPRVVQE